MEFNKPVSNPMLAGIIELLKEDEEKYKKEFWAEVLKAEYITPVYITPPPLRGKDGGMKIPPNSNIQFPTIGTEDGNKYLMAFTDKKEYDKWKPNAEKYIFTLNFDDYVGLLLQRNKEGGPNDTRGFIINPYGCNIIVSKEMIATLIPMRN
ncbi:MAG: SseB family protein [Lachnospiraceae bacterium]|nr:SseB family protein [Lachnospiraceae bacterium]